MVSDDTPPDTTAAAREAYFDVEEIAEEIVDDGRDATDMRIEVELADGRSYKGTVEHAKLQRDDPDTADIDVRVEFDAGVSVMVDGSDQIGMSPLGHLYAERDRSGPDPVELDLSNAHPDELNPVVGEVVGVDRLD